MELTKKQIFHYIKETSANLVKMIYLLGVLCVTDIIEWVQSKIKS